jgi:hypothetical protein
MRTKRPVRSRVSKQLEIELAPNIADREQPLIVRPKRARHMLGDPAETTFWKWVRDGEFEVIRIGHLTAVTVASLRAFLARHTVGGQKTDPEAPDRQAAVGTDQPPGRPTRPGRGRRKRPAPPSVVQTVSTPTPALPVAVD